MKTSKEMDMTKHSPGPWHVAEDIQGALLIADVDGHEVVEAVRSRDARLIAAAPEMLVFVASVANHSDGRTSIEILIDLQRAARALLARVEGK